MVINEENYIILTIIAVVVILIVVVLPIVFKMENSKQNENILDEQEETNRILKEILEELKKG